MPSRTAEMLRPFFGYVQACTDPSDRLFVPGFAPEVPYFAARRFGGGHVTLFGGYYSSDRDQRRMVRRMLGQSVPLAIVPSDGRAALGSLTIVSDFVQSRYVTIADIPVEGYAEPVLVLIRRDLAGAPPHQPTGWPCPSARPLA
ncbi:MAG: hypothetical protein H0T71_14045 [Acidobacteria bacterium]|nr:hypothetical protein [Acidobacteriota bacterium]